MRQDEIRGPVSGRALAPCGDAETSQDAAESVEDLVPTRNHRILAHLSRQPSTCDEIEVALGMLHQAASPCLWYMSGEGLVARDGEKRPTRSGRQAFVYRATDAGLAELAVSTGEVT